MDRKTPRDNIPEYERILLIPVVPYRAEELDFLITSLENVKVKAEDVMKMSIQDVNMQGEEIIVPFKDWEDGLWSDQRLYGLHYTKKIPDEPIDWGSYNDMIDCRSFADITILNTGPHHKPYETDIYYSTPEVIQVLKQWREYLIKTKEEEKKKEEKDEEQNTEKTKKDKPKSFFKKLFSKD